MSIRTSNQQPKHICATVHCSSLYLTITFLSSLLTPAHAAVSVNELLTQRVESSNEIIWEQVSPGNAGFSNLLRYHPTIPNKVFLCPDMWNFYKSENDGQSWTGITDDDGDGSLNRVRDLEFSPKDVNFGLTVSHSELWETRDGGKSWTLVKNCPWYAKKSDGTNRSSDGSDYTGWRQKAAAIGIDPTNSKIWFIAGGSNARGQEPYSCYQNETHTNFRGIENEFQGKLWRTRDGGSTWKLVTLGLYEKAQVGRIIFNPTNPSEIYLGSNYGVYKSVNGGDTWVNISHGKLDNDVIMDMDFYYSHEHQKFILYVIDQVHYIPHDNTTVCSGGLFYSEDLGATWTKMNGNLGLDFNRLSGGVRENYYKYIAQWFNITENDAKQKYPTLPTHALQYFNMLSTDPSREGTIYIGFADPQVGNSIVPGRLWKTHNNGKQWTNTARLYQHVWEADRAYWEERGNPWHANMTLGHESPHMQSGNNYALRALRALDVSVDGDVMIVSDHTTSISRNYGETWQQVDESYTPTGEILGHGNSNLPGLTIAQDARKTSTILGSGEHHAWIPSKERVNNRIPLRFIPSAHETTSNIAFDPYDVDIVYSTSSRQHDKEKIYKSIDGGHTWSVHGTATPATKKWLDDFYTNGLLIDPINNDYMYLGITKIVNSQKGHHAGFYVSNNGGKTFAQSNTGITLPARVNDIDFDPRDLTHKSLFASVQHVEFTQDTPLSEGGLYHSSNRGASWNKIQLPTQIDGVQFVEFDHTQRMYITTGFRTNWNGKPSDGLWYSDDFGKSWTQAFAYPGIECINVSPFDNNLIVVTAKFLSKNPGVYISRDRGITWNKSNTNITIPHEIEDIKFDIHNSSEIWLATKGCGFYKGKIHNGESIQVVTSSPKTITLSSTNPTARISASIKNWDKLDAQQIVWKSENPAIATVDSRGMVFAQHPGNVKIWAILDNRYSDFTVITVEK